MAVKLCPNNGEVYFLARSEGQVQKEHAMRRRVLKAHARFDQTQAKRRTRQPQGHQTHSLSAASPSRRATSPDVTLFETLPLRRKKEANRV